jgi:hypothetical protein
MKAYLPRDLARETHDVGCGTGVFGLKLLKVGSRVLFSDLSTRVLIWLAGRPICRWYSGDLEFSSGEPMINSTASPGAGRFKQRAPGRDGDSTILQ